MSAMLARAFVVLQYLLPRYGLTAIIYRVARIQNERVKNFLIRRFVKLYDVDTDEIKRKLPAEFATFNDFFVRELKDDARPLDAHAGSVVSPADGTVSACGTLRADRILQAKGRDYSLQDLLATDLAKARAYENGRFATIYLAPYNYHRVHAPVAGELVAARYVPGDLFSVNAATVSRIDGLFHRNERLILHFTTARGPAAVILVGALNVGSITTPWSGEIRPKKTGVVDVLDISAHPTIVKKGDLLGWFNMGSTVILLFPHGSCEWHKGLGSGQTLRMGEAIGTLQDAAK
ncbi:MAG: phosphatidylserine decarboxylase [Gammaproteobacteria bacterium]|nr:phosphatidylserine decarboxylase [Gammaproteobacteria bacterium]